MKNIQPKIILHISNSLLLEFQNMRIILFCTDLQLLYGENALKTSADVWWGTKFSVKKNLHCLCSTYIKRKTILGNFLKSHPYNRYKVLVLPFRLTPSTHKDALLCIYMKIYHVKLFIEKTFNRKLLKITQLTEEKIGYNSFQYYFELFR